jgi:hypothetical protein
VKLLAGFFQIGSLLRDLVFSVSPSLSLCEPLNEGMSHLVLMEND